MLWLCDGYFIRASLWVIRGDGEWPLVGDSVLVLLVPGDFTSKGVSGPCFVGFWLATILVINLYISCWRSCLSAGFIGTVCMCRWLGPLSCPPTSFMSLRSWGSFASELGFAQARSHSLTEGFRCMRAVLMTCSSGAAFCCSRVRSFSLSRSLRLSEGCRWSGFGVGRLRLLTAERVD